MDKSGAQVEEESAIRLLGEDLKFVSRGGLKLERALQYWNIDLRGRICLDVGASTGGFTDCLFSMEPPGSCGRHRLWANGFQATAGHRVSPARETNARYLTPDVLGETADFIAMDVSFISATLVIPAVIASAFPATRGDRVDRQIVVLVKPQFEAGRESVGKGGIVRDEQAQQASLQKVRDALLAFEP